jgi:hypothetical protein
LADRQAERNCQMHQPIIVDYLLAALRALMLF